MWEKRIGTDGYLYDIGLHILLSKDKEMRELMLGVVEGKSIPKTDC